MSFQISNHCKLATAPTQDAESGRLTNYQLVENAVPVPDAGSAEAPWRGAHAPQNRRLIAAITERRG